MSERPSSPGGLSDELRPYVDRAEAEAIDQVGDRLAASCPVLRPAYRSQLRAHLASLSEAQPWRPRRLKLAVFAYVGSGLFLLAIAAIGVAGSGPFAV
jgi:hypothetical protein